LSPALRSRLDEWSKKQGDQPSRSEAIRRLVDWALAHATSKRPASKKMAHKASKLAAREIEHLGDTFQTREEQQRRKRRLIHGPSEFREIRGDQPKKKG
jgi:metal-responsive CopG/Arc/MetJ family transcriptional regulator